MLNSSHKHQTKLAGHLLPALYQTELTNGWSVGMRRVTHALLPAVLPAGPILELGCGGGGLLRELAERVPQQTLYGMDRHPLALSAAQLHLAQSAPQVQLTQADLHGLPFAANSFGLICALDTFDQTGVDLTRGLAESWRVLQPQGMLLLRVSAHAWLQGAHDVAFNTGHRYAVGELQRLLHVAGYASLRITYANMLLAPPIVLLRLYQRLYARPLADELYVTAAVNRLLALALRCEARWLRRANLPFGISLYAIARK
jgi:ubiquinone/menaquinone biosynthesis C-methylase UbiE